MKVLDINVNEAFFKLQVVKNSHLIDVRSHLEWDITGIPDLSSLNKSVFLFEWEYEIKDSFKRKFQDMLINNFDKKSILFFICKSGVRSKYSANLALETGYNECYNIKDGYSNNNDLNWKNILPTKEL